MSTEVNQQYVPIGEAARELGLSEDALRYYEREGIVGPVSRDSAGRRQYSDADRAWIAVVTCMRDAGLGIADLRQFTALIRRDDESAERIEFLRRRRAEIVERRDVLTRAISVLDEKIDHFGGHS